MVGFTDNVGLVSLLILQKKANPFVLTNNGHPKPFKRIPKLVYDCYVSRRLKHKRVTIFSAFRVKKFMKL